MGASVARKLPLLLEVVLIALKAIDSLLTLLW